MTFSLTPEQHDVVDEQGSCVVIAKPGSGKTSTLSWKVARILPDLPHYKGVIAISYTNKASDELERKCLSHGVDRKGSFFGTIDRFFLSEIVIPFGGHVFGLPPRELQVVKLGEVEEIKAVADIESLFDAAAYESLVSRYLPLLCALFTEGKVILEAFGFLAVYVYNTSLACRRYLKARYSHVIIDEYQDCGIWQHIMFKSLVKSGICGIAVGDLDQSIFAFAKKDPKYLAELAQDDTNYAVYPLSINHRCHRSIINYSLRLLSPNSKMLSVDEIRVFGKYVVGSEIEIANWLSEAIPHLADYFQITEMSQVGILVRGTRTGNLVHRNLAIAHKPVITTPLDTETSLWGALFRKILNISFSQDLTKYELIETYLKINLQIPKVRKVMTILKRIEELAQTGFPQPQEGLREFVAVANLMLPSSENRRAIDSLKEVLSSRSYLESFAPPRKEEVQLMTLHKAKGLEFDIVFHLDLYKYILPSYKCTADEYVQCLNLHYVGITRAKKCCILCSSSERHNDQGRRDAQDSEFLHMNSLESLRVDCPF